METERMTTLNNDGTVTYYSVSRNRWINNAKEIPVSDLASMSSEERRMILDHIEGYGQ